METNNTQGAEPRQEDALDQLNTCLAALSSICGTQYPEAERLLAEATDAAARLRGRIAKLKSDAYTDPLTGLPNRTAYTYDLACVWDRQLEHTIVYIDIDGLKICNDRFGHPAGNRYITKVANCLKLHCHPDEHLYRIGGDEFVLISMTDSVDTLNQRLEACRASLATSTFDDGKTPMSYSYGCAHANPQAGDVLHKMTAEADRRMYDYKFTNAARNRTSRAFDEQHHTLDTLADFHAVQDRIFQALSLTDIGRYLFICNVDTDQSHWSHNAVQDFGLPSGTIYQMGEIWSQHIHPDDVDAWRQDIEEVMSGKKHHHNMRYRALDASGRYIIVTCSGIRLDGSDSEPTIFAGSITNSSIVESTDPATGVGDVRALMAAIEKRRELARPTDLVSFKFENIDRINAVYGYQTSNDVLMELIGRVQPQLAGSLELYRSFGLQFVLMFDSQPDIDLSDIAQRLQRTLMMPITTHTIDITPIAYTAFARYPSIISQPLTILSGLNRRLDAELRSKAPTFHEQSASVKTVGHATHDRRDKMTGLMRGNDFLYVADRHHSAHANENRAIVAIDLGRMRVFNEWYGRQAGDALIAEVGSTLQTLQADNAGLAGYWGQDDFVAYLPGDRESIDALYDRIQAIVASRDDSAGFQPAFGVCPIGPQERIDILLYDHAKAALNRARQDFKNRIKYFEPETYAQREREDHLLSAFQRALIQGQMTFHIQPQCDMETKKIIGGEALARWKDEDGSFVSPGTFVPLLERNGFAVTLDRYIWNLVFTWLSKRLAQGLPCVPISVNVSQTDLVSFDVAGQLERLAMQHAVPTHYVKVEITESAYADHPEDVKTLTSKLHALGFSVLIDDFGSGSSSLSMLQAIDADVIKLDGRFMTVESGKANKGGNIVKSVINMSWQIGMPVIVEGVETDRQIAFLHDLGVRYAQGFYYYRPMPVESFEALIADSASIDPRGILLHDSKRHIDFAK